MSICGSTFYCAKDLFLQHNIKGMYCFKAFVAVSHWFCDILFALYLKGTSFLYNFKETSSFWMLYLSFFVIDLFWTCLKLNIMVLIMVLTFFTRLLWLMFRWLMPIYISVYWHLCMCVSVCVHISFWSVFLYLPVYDLFIQTLGFISDGRNNSLEDF